MNSSIQNISEAEATEIAKYYLNEFNATKNPYPERVIFVLSKPIVMDSAFLFNFELTFILKEKLPFFFSGKPSVLVKNESEIIPLDWDEFSLSLG